MADAPREGEWWSWAALQAFCQHEQANPPLLWTLWKEGGYGFLVVHFLSLLPEVNGLTSGKCCFHSPPYSQTFYRYISFLWKVFLYISSRDGWRIVAETYFWCHCLTIETYARLFCFNFHVNLSIMSFINSKSYSNHYDVPLLKSFWAYLIINRL